MNDSIFCASHRQDETVIGSFFGQIGKVRAFPLTSVASTNEKNAGDDPLLHGVNDLVRHGKHDTMVKARGTEMRGLNGFGESLAVLGLFNDGGIVSFGSNVRDLIESDFVHGIDTILVHATGFHQTIGRDDNGSGEGGKFKLQQKNRANVDGNVRYPCMIPLIFVTHTHRERTF